MFTRYILGFSIVAFLAGPANLSAQAINERSLAYDLPAGQQVRMDLSAGEYMIRGAADQKLRVTWSSSDPTAADKVKVRFTTERGRTKLETDRTKNVKVTIELPVRSDLSFDSVRANCQFLALRVIRILASPPVS